MSDLSSVEILIVEDNPNDLDLTQRALHGVNLANRIRVARDGEEALALLFGENATSTPRLVLLDLNLPKVSGLDVLQRMKSDPRTRGIPVVVLTSSDDQSHMEKCYDLGVNSYIVKPVAFERFATAVQNLGLYWLILNEPPVPQN